MQRTLTECNYSGNFVVEKKIETKHRLNEEITSREVHLIMEDGRSAGKVSTDQAKYLADQYGLDLVELNGSQVPPIVRLLDYNKYRYQQEKQARGGAKVKNELKEVRLSFRIDSHDLETKAKRAKEFLESGSFVRVFMNLRGRENVFPEKGKQTMLGFQQAVGAVIEQPITQEGKRLQMIIKSGK